MVNVKIIGFLMVFAVILYPIANASAGQLTAGDVDDNLNFDLFLNYLENLQQSGNVQTLPSAQFSDRVTIRIRDGNGDGVSHAYVKITPEDSQSSIIETYAASNGIFRFFPTIDGAEGAKKFTVSISAPDGETSAVSTELDLDELDSSRSIGVVLEDYQSALPSSLDLMFVIDATGSMSDEMNYLTSEFKTIISGITQDYPGVSKRYSLVVYRDTGDQYVVRSYDFTDSLELMQDQLSDQSASGGGDFPEAMDQALSAAMKQDWRSGNTAKLLFLVADAPPHDDKMDDTLDHMLDARKMGIQVHSLAASGVGDTAEYIMRIGACLTHGRYLFLTDDSGLGNSHADPHIGGYVVTTLENLFIRIVKSELAGERVEATQNEIVRTVGTVTDGIIGASGEQQQQQSRNEQEPESSKFRSRGDGDDDDADVDEGYENDTGNYTGEGDGDGDEVVSEPGPEEPKASEIVVDGEDSEDGFSDDWESESAVPDRDGDGGGDYGDSDVAPSKLFVGEAEDDDSEDALDGSPVKSSVDTDDSKAVPAYETGAIIAAIGATVFIVARKRRK